MSTARGYFLILTTGVLFTSIAGGENFKCDQAARFGYADALCDPVQTRLTPIVPFAKADAAKDFPAFDAREAQHTPENQAEFYRQAARANQRAWNNYGDWNPVNPATPRGTFPAGEWSPLKFPPIGFPVTSSSPSTQAGRAIKH